MQVNLRTLGPNEAKVVLLLRLKGQEIVQASEIIDILGSESKARKVIRNLDDAVQVIGQSSCHLLVCCARHFSLVGAGDLLSPIADDKSDDDSTDYACSDYRGVCLRDYGARQTEQQSNN